MEEDEEKDEQNPQMMMRKREKVKERKKKAFLRYRTASFDQSLQSENLGHSLHLPSLQLEEIKQKEKVVNCEQKK